MERGRTDLGYVWGTEMTGLVDKCVGSVPSSLLSQEYARLSFHFATPPVLLLPKEGEGDEVIDQRSLVFGHPFPCGWDGEMGFPHPGTAGPQGFLSLCIVSWMPIAS